MQNKFIRFFLLEPSIRLRVVIVLLLVVGAVFEFYGYAIILRPRVAQALKNRHLVERIGKMEQDIHAKTSVELTNVSSAEINLQGIASSRSADYVLINGEVYQRGDKVGDYVVADITADTLMMRDQETDQQIFFNLSDSVLSDPSKTPLK